MRPIEYLTVEELFIYQSVKRDLKCVKSKKEIEVIEKVLDGLFERAISRYREVNCN